MTTEKNTIDDEFDDFSKMELDEIRAILKTRNYSPEKLSQRMREISEAKMEEAYAKNEKKRGFEKYIAGIILFSFAPLICIGYFLGYFSWVAFLFYVAPFSAGMFMYKNGKAQMNTKGRSYKERFKYTMRD